MIFLTKQLLFYLSRQRALSLLGSQNKAISGCFYFNQEIFLHSAIYKCGTKQSLTQATIFLTFASPFSYGQRRENEVPSSFNKLGYRKSETAQALPQLPKYKCLRKVRTSFFSIAQYSESIVHSKKSKSLEAGSRKVSGLKERMISSSFLIFSLAQRKFNQDETLFSTFKERTVYNPYL